MRPIVLVLILLTCVRGLRAMAQDFAPPPPPPIDEYEDGDDEFEGDDAFRPPPPPLPPGSFPGGAPPVLAPPAPAPDFRNNNTSYATEPGKFRFKIVDGEYWEKGKKRTRGQQMRGQSKGN